MALYDDNSSSLLLHFHFTDFTATKPHFTSPEFTSPKSEVVFTSVVHRFHHLHMLFQYLGKFRADTLTGRQGLRPPLLCWVQDGAASPRLILARRWLRRAGRAGRTMPPSCGVLQEGDPKGLILLNCKVAAGLASRAAEKTQGGKGDAMHIDVSNDKKQRKITEPTDEPYIAARNLFPNSQDIPTGQFIATFWGIREMPQAWHDRDVVRYLFFFTHGGREFLAGTVASRHAHRHLMSGKIWQVLSGFEPSGGVLTPATLEPYIGQKVTVMVESRPSKGTGRWFPLVTAIEAYRSTARGRV